MCGCSPGAQKELSSSLILEVTTMVTEILNFRENKQTNKNRYQETNTVLLCKKISFHLCKCSGLLGNQKRKHRFGLVVEYETFLVKEKCF